MTDPNVTAHLMEHPQSRSWVVDRCPYCGKEHTHGAGSRTDDPMSFLGHRISHCWRGGYYLEAKV